MNKKKSSAERMGRLMMSGKYLVVLLAKDQFFPWSDQDVQRKPEEEPVVILRERVLGKICMRYAAFIFLSIMVVPYNPPPGPPML